MSSNNSEETNESAEFTWKVANFSTLNESKSSVIFRTNDLNPFYLAIYPEDSKIPNHVAICLLTAFPLDRDLTKVWFKISLLNHLDEKCFVEEISTFFTKTSYFHPIRGGIYNIEKSRLLNSENRLLENDELRIFCQIEIQSRPNRNSQSTSCNCHNRELIHEALISNDLFTDVVLSVGGQEFKAHKNILSLKSRVFAEMFEGEENSEQSNRVEISEVSSEIWKQVLQFIYTDKITIAQQNVCDLFVISDKYKFESLKSICAEALINSVSIETVGCYIVLADMHNEPRLKSKCIEFINENSIEVMRTEGWNLMTERRPQLLLELYRNIVQVRN